MLFTSWSRFSRYLNCILVGLPIWYSLGLIVTFSPEIGRTLNLDAPIDAPSAVFWFYCGITLGSVVNGLVSQWLQSRKLAIGIFLVGTLVTLASFYYMPVPSAAYFLGLLFALGFFTAYWAMLVTLSAEQFGTNLRATVATSVPNFVRGAAFLMTTAFAFLKPELGVLNAAEVVGLIAAALALFALAMLKETFHLDLDYVETDAKPAKPGT